MMLPPLMEVDHTSCISPGEIIDYARHASKNYNNMLTINNMIEVIVF